MSQSTTTVIASCHDCEAVSRWWLTTSQPAAGVHVQCRCGGRITENAGVTTGALMIESAKRPGGTRE